MKAKKDKSGASKAAEKKRGEAAKQETVNELNAPCWSVVSFENLLASRLTYDEAARKMKEYAAQKVAGLCIVTDEAGEKVKSLSDASKH